MDAKLHVRIIKYNIISIIALLISTVGTYYMFEYVRNANIRYSYNSDYYTIVAVPIVVGMLIIAANFKSMKKYIYKYIAMHLEANNVNLDFEYDEGGTTLDNKSYFPYGTKESYLRSELKFDLSKQGTFDDLGFSYLIDEFSASATKGSGKYKKTIYSKSGVVINFEFTESINENAVVISSESFDNVSFKGGGIYSKFFIPALKDYTSETIETPNKIVIFSKENDFDRYKNINFSHEIFLREFHMVINKNTVSIFTPKDKFKIKMPIILTKSILEKLISDEKGKTYNLNTYLYDLAFIFKDI